MVHVVIMALDDFFGQCISVDAINKLALHSQSLCWIKIVSRFETKSCVDSQQAVANASP